MQSDVIGLYKWNYSSTGKHTASEIATYEYDAWGKLTNIQIPADTGDRAIALLNPIRYRGYYYDSESGFYYLRSRYYDPAISRFLNADEYSSTGQGFLGYNMYAYCNNNPVALSDNSGCIPVSLVDSVCPKKGNVGSAPDFVKDEGRGGYDAYKTTPNCYAYALDYHGAALQPGMLSRTYCGMSVESVANAVLNDLEFLHRGGRIISGYDASIEPDEYRIALRVKENPQIIGYTGIRTCDAVYDWDYHFMIQTSTGQWAEKHGTGGSSICHAVGMTPDVISWDCGTSIGYYNSDII